MHNKTITYIAYMLKTVLVLQITSRSTCWGLSQQHPVRISTLLQVLVLAASSKGSGVHQVRCDAVTDIQV